MPASQLKQLKASLREQGVVGPQRSKKQKKQSRKPGGRDKVIARNEAIQNIRERFNPFEAKAPARGHKFQFANAQDGSSPVGRPGVTKGLGEEAVQTFHILQACANNCRSVERPYWWKCKSGKKLVELETADLGTRAPAISVPLDILIAFREDDPTMTPEQKALERFVKEKQRGKGGKSRLFDLEEDQEDIGSLTHLGMRLGSAPNEEAKDDFRESTSDRDTDLQGEKRGKKRRRLSEESVGNTEGAVGRPEQPKSKQEIYKEIIAKSKLQKYERQKTKEEDDDLLAELDEGLGDVYALLRDQKTSSKPEPLINPDRLALLGGKDRKEADREYDERLRKMTFDARAKPSVTTKTAEEKAEEDARKLKELEEQRLQRMKEVVSDEEGHSGEDNDDDFVDGEFNAFENGFLVQPAGDGLEVEDEDDFILDNDLIASDPELTESEHSISLASEHDTDTAERELTGDFNDVELTSPSELENERKSFHNERSLPFTFPCPQTLPDMLKVIKDVSWDQLSTAIQRIRALHDPKLSATRELEEFSAVLVEYIPHILSGASRPPFHTIEQLLRQLHSLAKSFPTKVSEAFRGQLRNIQKERPLKLNSGDLITLTAIGTIFPTSDHWHQVCNPALLLMARYIQLAIPKTVADLATKTYVGTLCLTYQRLSKRYIPELVNHFLNVIHVLSPHPPREPFGLYPTHKCSNSLRIGSSGTAADEGRKLNFWDINLEEGSSEIENIKLSILQSSITLIRDIAELWLGKSSYYEIMQPFSTAFQHLQSKRCKEKLPNATNESIKTLHRDLSTRLAQALRDRKPLALHTHRPLPIKMAIPRFEESFHPAKHYDPDRERTELSKLKAEHKRERKGALRELRKDASFIAREQLREKKERDEAYEKKYRRLVAEIQGEEGREAKEYEREKRARKRRR